MAKKDFLLRIRFILYNGFVRREKYALVPRTDMPSEMNLMRLDDSVQGIDDGELVGILKEGKDSWTHVFYSFKGEKTMIYELENDLFLDDGNTPSSDLVICSSALIVIDQLLLRGVSKDKVFSFFETSMYDQEMVQITEELFQVFVEGESEPAGQLEYLGEQLDRMAELINETRNFDLWCGAYFSPNSWVPGSFMHLGLN